MTEVLEGKTLAQQIKNQVTETAEKLKAGGAQPKLAVVVATDDGGTDYYVRHIAKAAGSTGLLADIIQLGNDATQEQLASKLTELAADESVHGIILQTPLPNGVDADPLRELIPPAKDIDGANPLSAGRLISGQQAFAPSTAQAVMELLKHHGIGVAGRHVTVIGRSLVVGKPLAHLLLTADATVTICHSKTSDLPSIAKQADILVVAIGRAEMIGANYIKPGAVVIDVGTNATEEGKLVGDVNAAVVENIAGSLSPVPGGIGPVTTALLLQHTTMAAQTKM